VGLLRIAKVRRLLLAFVGHLHICPQKARGQVLAKVSRRITKTSLRLSSYVVRIEKSLSEAALEAAPRGSLRIPGRTRDFL
jgi:hypothetical protein